MRLSWVILWCTAASCAGVLLTTTLPLSLAAVGTALVLVGGAAWVQRRGRQVYATSVARVEAVKGVKVSESPSRWVDPGLRLENLNRDLAVDLEEAYFRLIKTNIQLLSLKEVGRSIISSLDESRTVQSVLEYLNRGVGFNEYGLFTWKPEEGVFAGGVRHATGNGFEWVERHFPAHVTSGLLAKCLALQRSVLIRDAEVHGLGHIDGDPVLPGSCHQSFVVVPLVRSAPVVGQRQEQDCRDCADTRLAAWVQTYAPPPLLEETPRCWGCAGSPVLGCLLATDAGRDQPLSKVDLVLLETLAQNLATVLENSQLYEDLRRAERFRENVIGGLSNGLLSIDLEGRVLLVNEAAKRISGYDEASLRYRSSDGLIVDVHGRNPLREALRNGRSRRSRSLEATLRTRGGGAVPIQLTTSLLRDDSGTVFGVIAEFADLSELKRMQAQIRHLDKLAALGRFTSSIAHEIRNPLAGITAGIQYMTRGFTGADAEHVGFILAEVERLNRIINDLFDAGRPLQLNLHPTRVQELVERSIRALEPRFAERQVLCKLHVVDDLPPMNIDADRIEQVLINLIQNAIDVSPAGAVVSVSLRPGASREPFANEPQGETDSLVICVDDQGEGIDEKDREKIFEPFYTTKSRGTGLGLYVCHHIVEGHGGQIAVDSQPGKGSRFLLCLPVGRSLMEESREAVDFARR